MKQSISFEPYITDRFYQFDASVEVCRGISLFHYKCAFEKNTWKKIGTDPRNYSILLFPKHFIQTQQIKTYGTQPVLKPIKKSMTDRGSAPVPNFKSFSPDSTKTFQH